MFCRNCGAENRQDAKFCCQCASSLVQMQPEKAEEPAPKKKGGKGWLIALIAVVVLAAVVACIRLMPKDAGQAESEVAEAREEREEREEQEAEEEKKITTDIYPPTFQTFSTGDGYAVAYQNTVLLKSEGPIQVVNNVDGSAAACLTKEGLYLADALGATRITEEEADYTDIRIACDGAAMTYVVDDVLYHYSTETEQTEEIEEDVSWHALSPYGRYVVYQTDDGLYRWNGTREILDSNEVHYRNNRTSISDEGLVYTVWWSGKKLVAQEYDICCFDESGTRSVIQSAWDMESIVFNKLQNQIMFSAYDEEGIRNLYFSENGEPAKKVLEEAGGIGTCFATGTWERRAYRNYDCPVEDLKGQIFIVPLQTGGGVDNCLFYLSEELEGENVLSFSMYRFDLTYERACDNSYVYAHYRKSDENHALYSIDAATGEKEKVAEEVEWFVSAGDGMAYFSDEDWNLYRPGEDGPELIAQNIKRMHYMGTRNGGVLYLDEDRTLWLAEKDGEPEKLEEQVRSFWRDGSCFYYRCGEEDELQDVYFSRDGETFSAIEGIYYEEAESEES